MSITATKKGIFAALGIGVFALSYYSYKKYKIAKAIIEKLKVRTKNIKNVNVSFDTIRFTTTLELYNDTLYDLGFTTGSVISLKKIQIYTPNRELIADIYTHINSLEVLAFESYRLPDLQVEIPTHSLVSQFNNITEYLTANNLQYDLTIKAFGKEFIITT